MARVLGVAFVCLLSLGSVAEDARTAIDPAGLTTMLDEGVRIENFRHMERIFPVKTVGKSETPFQFEEDLRDLDVTYTWNGEDATLEEFLEKTVTTALLVVKDDAIVFEYYGNGNTKDSNATSMSVSKSFTSALIGIAIEEGHIDSIDDPVEKYAPALKESGYAGVPIRHLLQMSSGIDFSEVYEDETSDIIVMMGRLAMGESIVDYAAQLKSAGPSGERFNYASIDTNVLGMIIENATGKNPAAYLEEKIWRPIGMESDATWATDNAGNVLTFAWLNVTARDYAKFGRLYLREGDWDGTQVVPKAWVRESVTPGKDYLKLKDHYVDGWDIGYQYQWWVPAGDEGEFTGIGVWGQYLYVNPARNVIIVKNSVDPGFDARDMETVAVFRAIAESVD